MNYMDERVKYQCKNHIFNQQNMETKDAVNVYLQLKANVEM